MPRGYGAVMPLDGQPRLEPAALSARELEVLRYAARGHTNAQVAASLGLSVHAVKFHLASIFRKLGVRNRTEAAVAYLGRDRED
jgi:DNA-binding CsgD family transcriptional regulator